MMSVTVGVLALLEAKPERAADLAALLEQARALAIAEQQTVSWYAFQVDAVTYGIFDTFESDEGRRAHLGGEIAATLMKVAPDLLAKDPDIRQVDLLAVK
jgi:quinol monooxygenase YgiN